MLLRQSLLSGLGVLVVCLIAFVYNQSYNEQVSLAQDEPSHDDCLASVQKIMKALDFSSLREYENHVLSTGKALPCGLNSNDKAENISLSVESSHKRKQTSLWEMIFGNFFGDDAHRDHEKSRDKQHKLLKSSTSRVGKASERIHIHPKIVAVPTNSTLLRHHNEEHPSPSLVDPAEKATVKTSDKNVANDRPLSPQKQIVSISKHESGVVRDDQGRAVNFSRPSPETRLHDDLVTSSSHLSLHDDLVTSSSHLSLSRRAKSQSWLTKLRREAYHLGYALVPQNRDVGVRSADHVPRELSSLNSEARHDFVVKQSEPAVRREISETLVETSKARNSVEHGFVAEGSVKRKSGVSLKSTLSAFNAGHEDVKVHLSLPHISRSDLRPRPSLIENAFDPKDEQRLGSEEQIEAAMHARLQAEARLARENLDREGTAKAVQAQHAAMDAIQRYANVISFHDSVSDKAKFEKLSLDDRSSGLAKKNDNTIRTKILRSEELRNEASKAADKQLQSYGFLQFSDDGIHDDLPRSTAGQSLADTAHGGGGISEASGRSSVGVSSARDANRGSPMQWNGRGIPRFDKP